MKCPVVQCSHATKEFASETWTGATRCLLVGKGSGGMVASSLLGPDFFSTLAQCRQQSPSQGRRAKIMRRAAAALPRLRLALRHVDFSESSRAPAVGTLRTASTTASSVPSQSPPPPPPVLGEVDRQRMVFDLRHIQRKVFPSHPSVRRAALLLPFCHVHGTRVSCPRVLANHTTLACCACVAEHQKQLSSAPRCLLHRPA
jgi:hypothetical protein